MANTKLNSMLYPVCRVILPAGASSGVFISDTFVLTVFHSIKEAITTFGTSTQKKEIRHPVTCEVFTNNKKKPTALLADIYAYDEAQDVALLKLKKETHKYCAKLIDYNIIDKLEVFDEVYVVGASLGHEPLPTKGIITYKREEIDFGIYWMTDAHILVGNSGGGVFVNINDEYYLIGITTSFMVDEETEQSTHLTHFVPPQSLHNFISSLNIAKETGIKVIPE